jgi:hypothetical protein
MHSGANDSLRKGRALVTFITLLAFLLLLISGSALAEGENIKINSDATTELQNEQACVINPNNSDNVVGVWRDFRLGYRQIGVGNTFDAGQTWVDSLFRTFPYNRVSDPVMSYGPGGDIIACGLTYDDASNLNGLYITRTSDGGQSWSIPTVAVDEGIPAIFEDKQWMTVDRTGGAHDGRIYIPWTRFSATVDIYMVHTILNTDIFSAPIHVSDQGNVQWPTVTVTPDGTVFCAWVAFNDATIKYDKSTDGGDTWGVDQTLTPVGITSAVINGGITTFAFPAMDADITGGPYNGNLYILNANTYDGTSELDLEFRRSTDGGTSWSSPVRVNDDPTGNGIDQFHPWIQVNEDGILTAIWFDRRNDPSNLKYDLYMSHSFDAGATWLPNRRISTVSSNPLDAKKRIDTKFYQDFNFPIPTTDPGKQVLSPQAGLIGEYTGLSVRQNQVQVIWTDTRNGNQDCYTARLTVGLGAPNYIAPEDALITNDNQPTFSWTKSGPDAADLAPFTGTLVKPLLYTLQIDDDPAFGSVDYEASGLTGTSHQFGSPISDGDWYWRVFGVNTDGDTTNLSEPSRFLTIDTQAPAIPTLILPAAEDTVAYDAPMFQWGAVTAKMATPVSYHLQVAQDAGFTTLAIDSAGLTGTSFAAAPLASASDFYFRVEATDAALNSSGFSAANHFFTTAAFICGDADGSGAVSVADAVYLINYIFGGGPAPVPLAAGDPDCSGGISIGDAVYIIQFIFGGGPVPCASCM